ncbi:hypothetical protein O4H49_13800 [Kiloniella laminariae]|uniref:ABC-type transport auxiliary lipoprotein component domain-containing protein n=1 Tax=Kiloniella laminariae TaxID=454162 RepID=A0ABT4LL72_9PROT|nr:hypothetical protein [Kiloniella laminariae]MCZ4281860.1 hypothetical protein [Kiloniella laminariae]
MRVSVLLLLTGLVSFLAACGPLPRPFIDPEPTRNPLLHLSGTQPLSVGLPRIEFMDSHPFEPDLALWAQDTLSKDLLEQGLPASKFHPTISSLYLESRFFVTHLAVSASNEQEAVPQPENVVLSLETRVSDSAAPSPLFELQEQTQVPGQVLAANPKILMQELISRTAVRLNREILAEKSSVSGKFEKTPSFQNRLYLSALPDSLPEKSRENLMLELRTSLQLRGINLQPENKLETSQIDPPLILQLEIDQKPETGLLLLTLRWKVIDHNSGEQIGLIEQTNPVPLLPLSRIIDPAAEVIAEGAASGIADLLQQKSLQNQSVLN